jgi:hypothetical protein
VGLYSTPVEAAVVVGTQARRLGLSKAPEVLDTVAVVVAVGSMRFVALPRLLRRVCSTAEG